MRSLRSASRLQVREVALEAIARARRGDGPTLIEAETYRFRGHSLADPDELRSKEEKAHYAARDPIPQLKKYILENKLVTGEARRCSCSNCIPSGLEAIGPPGPGPATFCTCV